MVSLAFCLRCVLESRILIVSTYFTSKTEKGCFFQGSLKENEYTVGKILFKQSVTRYIQKVPPQLYLGVKAYSYDHSVFHF
jgi:hypothetical protein